jgi:hypothetical protein
MWKNVVEPEATNDGTLWRMRVTCWINKATLAPLHPHTRAARTHTQICNTYCYFTVAKISEPHPSVTTYVHCFSWICTGTLNRRMCFSKTNSLMIDYFFNKFTSATLLFQLPRSSEYLLLHWKKTQRSPVAAK